MYRVILIDDEPLIRTGLASFVDWESLNCQILRELEDGQEALAYISENEADIIVCDIKMPHMSGLQLAKELRERGFNIKIIFLTAFSDFSYAQEAIRYQVVDYVVKTNYIEKIPFSIEKAIREIEMEREKLEKHKEMQKKINSSEKEIHEKFIHDVIDGVVTNSQKIKDMALFSGLDFKQYMLIAFCLEDKGASADGVKAHDKILQKIHDFISLAYQDRELISVLFKRNTIISLLLADNTDMETSCGKIQDETRRVVELIESSMGLSMCVGISLPHDNFTELRTAYVEAQTVVESMSFYCEYRIEAYKPGQAEYKWPTKTFELLNPIINSIQHFSKDEALNLIDRMFDDCQREQLPAKEVKRLAVIICSECHIQIINHKRTDNLTDQGYMPTYQDIHDSGNINELRDVLKVAINLTEQALTAEERAYTFLVRQVISFIQSHSTEKLNVAVIAKHLHVSKSYLGNLYKKEVGESIVDTIAKYRVERAVEMLQDTLMQVSEISTEVGFDDPAYFANVFVKYMGISPSAYRNTFL